MASGQRRGSPGAASARVAAVSFLALFGMWLAMTALMMVPVVHPWLRALHRITGTGTSAPTPTPPPPLAATPVALFLAGYAVAWTGFSAAAALLHFVLLAARIPVPFGAREPLLSAGALFLAGAWQFTPLKRACLSHCRSPAGFLLTHWRDGFAGQLRLGAAHGVHCVGCCWALMALALVVGMADLRWMALLMGVMVAETALPWGARLARPLGALLIAAGAVILASGGPS